MPLTKLIPNMVIVVHVSGKIFSGKLKIVCDRSIFTKAVLV